jgi:hypothetical protein
MTGRLEGICPALRTRLNSGTGTVYFWAPFFPFDFAAHDDEVPQPLRLKRKGEKKGSPDVPRVAKTTKKKLKCIVALFVFFAFL